MKGKKKHHGSATHSVHPKSAGKSGHGSNLKFPATSQAIHVKQQKDTMAHNVGGSAAHMMPDAKSMGHQELNLSGGKGKPKKATLRY